MWKRKKQIDSQERHALSVMHIGAPHGVADAHHARIALRTALLLGVSLERAVFIAQTAVQTCVAQRGIHPDVCVLRMTVRHAQEALRHKTDAMRRADFSTQEFAALIPDPVARTILGIRLADHVAYETLSLVWHNRTHERLAHDVATYAYAVYRAEEKAEPIAQSIFMAIFRMCDLGMTATHIAHAHPAPEEVIAAVCDFHATLTAAAEHIIPPAFFSVPALHLAQASSAQTVSTPVSASMDERFSLQKMQQGMSSRQEYTRMTQWRTAFSFFATGMIAVGVMIGGIMILSQSEHEPAVLGAETAKQDLTHKDASSQKNTEDAAHTAVETLRAQAEAAKTDAMIDDILAAPPTTEELHRAIGSQ